MILKKDINDVTQLTIDFWKWLYKLIKYEENGTIIDSRTATTFIGESRIDDFSRFYHRNYGLIPCDRRNGSSDLQLDKSILTVFDPIEVMHNTCRKYTIVNNQKKKERCVAKLDAIISNLVRSKIINDRSTVWIETE